MVASPSPTALRKWIAFELRRLRERAGISRETAAGRLGKSATQVGHMETGRNLPTPGDAELLLTLYGHADRTEVFRELIKRAKKGRDWWIGFSSTTVPVWLTLYLGLESSAVQVQSWDSLIVPGILQTPAYAKAVIRSGEPLLDDAEVQRRVDLRVERQTVLDRAEAPLRVWSVMAEHVLRTPVGGPEVLAEQLDHLVKMAQRPTIDLQVLPTAVGGHTGFEGTFTLLTYPPELVENLGTVYVEDRIQGHYYEDSDQIDRYRDVLTRLQSAAPAPADSADMINRIAQEVRR